MGFKLPKNAERYFRYIEKRADGIKFKLLFDQYYFCLMAGFRFRKLGSNDALRNEPFIDYYVDHYREKAEIIAGLLIDAEIERSGIPKADRRSVEKLMLELIDHMSITKLSKRGMDLLNLYAAGGMGIIEENIDQTADLEVFLVNYYQLMNVDEVLLGQTSI